MALNIIDNNALAPATSTPTKEKDYSNLPGKESYDTGYMLTEQPKLNPPPATTTPIVQTSGLAQNDVDSTKNFLDWAKTNLGTQAQNAAAALMNENTTKEQKDEALRKAKLEQQKADNETKKTNALTGADTGTDTTTDTTGVKGAGYYTISSSGKKTWHSTDGSGSGEQSGIQDENDQALADFQNMTNKMLNGTFPLNPLQQAQLNAMKTQFTELIDAQKAANKQYEGAIQQSGITGGRSRYAPEIMAGEVLNSVNVGIKKVAELNSKMTGALAEMEAGFQENNFKLVQDSYKAFTDAQKLKQDNIDNINKQIADALKATNEANAKAKAELEKTRTEVLISAKEGGAPTAVLQAISDAEDVANIVNSAGDYLQSTSGIVGEYNYYKRQATLAGQTPVDFMTYQNIDANRKALASGAGSMLYSPAQEKIIERVDRTVAASPAYSSTISMQKFVNNTLAALEQETGVGDIAAINQFQKVIDEGAVTRDQDVKLIQGAQSLADTVSLKIEKLRKGDQLSETLRAQMKQAVTDIYNAQLKAIEKDPFINSKKKELERNKIDQADTIFGQLSGLSSKTADDVINIEKQAEQSMTTFGDENPTERAKILQMRADRTSWIDIQNYYNQ